MGLPIKEIINYTKQYLKNEKFGIIGNPIKHSLSPVLHQYWFDKYGLNASYTIIEAEDKDLKSIAIKLEIMSLLDLTLLYHLNKKLLIKRTKLLMTLN